MFAFFFMTPFVLDSSFDTESLYLLNSEHFESYIETPCSSKCVISVCRYFPTHPSPELSYLCISLLEEGRGSDNANRAPCFADEHCARTCHQLQGPQLLILLLFYFILFLDCTAFLHGAVREVDGRMNLFFL